MRADQVQASSGQLIDPTLPVATVSLSGAEVSGGGSDADEARLMDAELAIAGCVTYVLPAGRAVGQTGFLYDVARNCGDAELVLPCSFDLNRPGDYERLSVTGATYTGFAR